MDMEVIKISQKEDKRYRLLTRVISGQIALAEATDALGVGYRQEGRLKKTTAEEGLRGMAHGNRGQAPSNKLSLEFRQKVVELSSERYSGLGDTHFTEMLMEREGICISRESVRKIRRDAGVKPKEKRRAKKHHKRRPRKAAEGMMMLWDGSPHRWFGPGESTIRTG